MSNRQHTKEPWCLNGFNLGSVIKIGDGPNPLTGRSSIDGRHQIAIALCPDDNPNGIADAARIVACVNACAGMDDPAKLRALMDEADDNAAHHQHVSELAVAESTQLRAQRDALAEALTWCLPHVEEALAKWGNVNAGGSRQAIAKARAALAKVQP